MIFKFGMRKTTIMFNLIEIVAFMPIGECVSDAFYIDFRIKPEIAGHILATVLHVTLSYFTKVWTRASSIVILSWLLIGLFLFLLEAGEHRHVNISEIGIFEIETGLDEKVLSVTNRDFDFRVRDA